MAILVAILLVATSSLFELLPKAIIVGALTLTAAFLMKTYYLPDEREAFLSETWWLTKKIFPLLVVGTFITGMIGYFLPVEWIRTIFGTNSFFACFVASVIGALLYMPTLLEVPNCRHALRLQYRRHCSGPSAIPTAGWTFFEPAQHDSNHKDHWPEKGWRLYCSRCPDIDTRRHDLRSNCIDRANA